MNIEWNKLQYCMRQIYYIMLDEKERIARLAPYDAELERQEMINAFGEGAVVIDVMIFGYSVDVTGPIGWIFTIVIFLPSIAVGARRLHDTDKTGWWQLLWITFIGGLLIIIWQATMGEKKKNKYGSPVRK